MPPSTIVEALAPPRLVAARQAYAGPSLRPPRGPPVQVASKPRSELRHQRLGQAATTAAPIRPRETCASLSTTHRVSVFCFVNPQATTRDWRRNSAHSVRTESVAPVLCGTVKPLMVRCIESPSALLPRISSMAESAAGLTALLAASSSNSRPISAGVLTPSPYFTELSIATLVRRR